MSPASYSVNSFSLSSYFKTLQWKKGIIVSIIYILHCFIYYIVLYLYLYIIFILCFYLYYIYNHLYLYIRLFYILSLLFSAASKDQTMHRKLSQGKHLVMCLYIDHVTFWASFAFYILI